MEVPKLDGSTRLKRFDSTRLECQSLRLKLQDCLKEYRLVPHVPCLAHDMLRWACIKK